MISAIWRVVAATSRAAIWMSAGAPRKPGGALVDHQLRVRQREPLPRRAAGDDHRRGGHAHPEADRAHVGPDVLHRVVDGQPRVGRAAG